MKTGTFGTRLMPVSVHSLCFDNCYRTTDYAKVHQMAEDYTNMVGSIMYPATQFNSYGYNPEERQYPIEKISLLRFMKSPLRRPTVMEKWSPYEIAIFEGSLLHYGKEFGTVSKQIGTKTTKEVIDFYYVWKIPNIEKICFDDFRIFSVV